jgi:alpha-glucosidase
VPKKPTPPQPEVYGTYTPYVPPAKPVQPIVRPASPAEPVDVPPDPNTLPGFTASEIQGPAALNGATANAAVEESNPNSLLNFYRHLIALHHDNGSLRNGSETLFDRDAVNALAWVRRAPAGSRTSASVVVAANLSDRPVYLSLAEEFTEMHIRGGTLRPLLTASAGENVSGIIPLQSAERLVLQPYSVFLGELYHSGAEEPGAASGRRTKRRSRRH